jgi:nitrilase
MQAIVIQSESGARKSDNIAQIGALIEAAIGSTRPALVSLPEMWSCLGADRATKLAESEHLPEPGDSQPAGPAYTFLRDTALRHGIILHGGSIGERVGDTLYNTTLVFDAEGRECARYRKIHLFDVTTPSGQGYRESSLFGAAGSRWGSRSATMCAFPNYSWRCAGRGRR